MKKYAGSDMELEFRCDIPFPCKESLDLSEPFVDFFEVEIGPKKIPNLSFVHFSIDPVEEDPVEQIRKTLTKVEFKSPEKVKGVNMGTDKCAQFAAVL